LRRARRTFECLSRISALALYRAETTADALSRREIA
jgi:hypothetical protein